MTPDELLEAARAWRDEDPDPADRDDLDRLLADAAAGGSDAPAALDELGDRFGTRLEFGTAGLRGEMGAGPNRMNRAVVIRATAGLASYLATRGHRGEPVIVGYDARHRSSAFAEDAAGVLAAAGFPVLLGDRPVPTPVVAFGVRHLRCCAGVQVTASHNPPADNGYKVYLGDGAQIAPPTDAEISAAIDQVGPLAGVPRVAVRLVATSLGAAGGQPGDPDNAGPAADGSQSGARDGRPALGSAGRAAAVPDSSAEEGRSVGTGVTLVGDELIDAYVTGVTDLMRGDGPRLAEPAAGAGARVGEAPRDLRIVYTPLHGVGRDVVLAAFDRAGFPAPHVVTAQADPDPDFPTVRFPNPEEPGALDLALAEGRRHDADVVLANDPDADRLAVVVPQADGWRPLTGDEIGVLLADWLLSRDEGADRLVVTTVVSSSLLGRLAAARGVGYAETLTGFKWIARAALDRPELRFVLGYEEALGYSVGSLVRDKDGVSAALAMAELIACEKRRGRTVLDRLDDLARELGLHATGQRSLRFAGLDGAERMRRAVDRLASDPPPDLVGRPLTEVEDLRRGRRLPPTEGVVLRADGLRLIVRPSGTEPKLKYYAEALVPVPAGGDVAATRGQGANAVTALLDAATALVDG